MRTHKVYRDTRTPRSNSDFETGTKAQHRAVAHRHGIEIRESLGREWFRCPSCRSEFRLPSKAVTCCGTLRVS